jgi:hypothetical protein
LRTLVRGRSQPKQTLERSGRAQTNLMLFFAQSDEQPNKRQRRKTKASLRNMEIRARCQNDSSNGCPVLRPSALISQCLDFLQPFEQRAPLCRGATKSAPPLRQPWERAVVGTFSTSRWAWRNNRWDCEAASEHRPHLNFPPPTPHLRYKITILPALNSIFSRAYPS